MKTKNFNDSIHNFGMISTTVIILLMLATPTVTCLMFGVWPDFQMLIPTFISVSLILVPYCFAECIAYPPIMGPGAVYMAYVTGNTTTVKMPCALSSLAIANIEQGSDEANAVSLISVGTSSLVVIAMIVFGILLAKPLSPILNSPALQPAFKNIVPALMGAMLGGNILKNEKFFIGPLIIAYIIVHFTKVPAAYIMLIVIAVSVICGYLINKKSTSKNTNIQ